MLRLAGERETLRVVADQHGCPTWADDLADGLLQLSPVADRAGIYHYCGAGATTWHGFASAIIAEGRRHRDLRCTQVDAITTADYPTPAKRPAYTVMSTQRLADLGIATPSWTTGMQRVVAHVLGET
jgi:dTDP-4-dehydrorhamnose reductase